MQSLYFIFYNDEHCTSVHEIWRTFIHSVFRLDVNCIVGQTNSTSLVIRGPSVSKNAMCFSSMPQEVSVGTSGPLKLIANSLNEIIVQLRPGAQEGNDVLLNIVDSDSFSLLSSWLIVVHSTLPTITKVFELKLPKGKTSNKKVSYTNPFLQRKVLSIQSDSPHLLQFKESVLDFDGGATQYIGLRFSACSNLNTADILIFLNNEFDRVEECLSIKVRYE